MSLSRSEEMHRLTENVYKVSSAPPARSRPPGRSLGSRGSSRRGRGDPVPARHKLARAPSSRQPPVAPALPGAGALGPE